MHKGYLPTSLGQIHYRRLGTGNPVVLLGQSGRSSRMHHRLMGVLASSYDVIALDMPGTGESAPLQHGTSFEAIADSFLSCLQQLNLDTVNLYGIHTGNKIGAAMAARSPRSVRRFVFAGQSHSIIPGQQLRNATILSSVSNVVEGDRAELSKALLDWTGKLAELGSYGLSRATLLSISEHGNFDEPLERLVDDLQAMASRAPMYAANFSYDLQRDLERLSIPTLILEIVTPEEDRRVGRQGPAVLQLLKHGQLVSLAAPDGHGLTLEDQAEELGRIFAGFFG